MKKILITGGSGFLGLNIIENLLKNRSDIEVYNCSRTAINLKKIKNIKCDAIDFDFDVLNCFEFDYIINLLALSNNRFCEDFDYACKINIDFTKRLLDFSKTQKKIKKIVHLSSIIIYDNSNLPPVKEDGKLYLNYNNYSFTKGISEFYANYYMEKYDLPLVIFRLSNIYGPHQKFINSPFLVPSKIMQALNEKKIEVFNLNPKRDWIYSEDAAKAIIKSLDSDCVGIYNLAIGKGISVEEIVKEMSKQLGVNYKTLNSKTTGPLNFYCNVNKLKKELNWSSCTGLEKGISKTINYIKKNLN